MSRNDARVLVSSVFTILFVLSAAAREQLALGQAKEQPKAQAKTPRKAQPAATPAAQPEWLQINITRVKPDTLTEWLDFQRNETIPALKKAGVKWRATWTTAIFGEALEYVLVTPIESFAQYDGGTAIDRALGAEGARNYRARSRRLISSSHVYAVRTRPDLSYAPEMTGPPKLGVITSVHVAPGRHLAFESFVKNQVLPVMRRAKVAGYEVSQSVFGGDANEYVSVTLYDTFADIGKGSPFVRVLGQAGADALAARAAGLVHSLDRSVSQFVPELSFMPSAPAK